MDPLSGETTQPVLTFPPFLTGEYFYEKEFASRRKNSFLFPSKEQRTFLPGKQKGSHKIVTLFKNGGYHRGVSLCAHSLT